MSKLYTCEQILFALRTEYLEIEKQLDDLRQCFTIDSEIAKCYFQVSRKPNRMFLYLKQRKKFLDYLFHKHIGYKVYNITEGITDFDYCAGNGVCHVKNIDEANFKMQQLMQTDFYQNITANNGISIPCIENDKQCLYITSNSIVMINTNDVSCPQLEYLAYKDELVIRIKKGFFNSNEIYALLNLRINDEYLNDYHRRILYNYMPKTIKVGDGYGKACTILKIVDEPKKIILVPQKKGCLQ